MTIPRKQRLQRLARGRAASYWPDEAARAAREADRHRRLVERCRLTDGQREFAAAHRWLALWVVRRLWTNRSVRRLGRDVAGQVAFLGLIQAVRGHRPGESEFSSYAVVVVRNYLLREAGAVGSGTPRRWQRSARARQAWLYGPQGVSLGLPGYDHEGGAVRAAPADWRPGPAEEAERADLAAAVRAALADPSGLTAAERHVVEQCVLHGRICKDVGADLGLTRQRVHQILCGALGRLRRALERKGVGV